MLREIDFLLKQFADRFECVAIIETGYFVPKACTYLSYHLEWTREIHGAFFFTKNSL